MNTEPHTVGPYIDPDQMLDIDDFACLLKVSKKWVEQQVQGDAIPYSRIGPRLVRFSRDDIADYYASCKVRPVERPNLAQLAQLATVSGVGSRGRRRRDAA